jgi:hypothetical protein
LEQVDLEIGFRVPGKENKPQRAQRRTIQNSKCKKKRNHEKKRKVKNI